MNDKLLKYKNNFLPVIITCVYMLMKFNTSIVVNPLNEIHCEQANECVYDVDGEGSALLVNLMSK